jgi:hypothetical protein
MSRVNYQRITGWIVVVSYLLANTVSALFHTHHGPHSVAGACCQFHDSCPADDAQHTGVAGHCHRHQHGHSNDVPHRAGDASNNAPRIDSEPGDTPGDCPEECAVCRFLAQQPLPAPVMAAPEICGMAGARVWSPALVLPVRVPDCAWARGPPENG